MAFLCRINSGLTQSCQPFAGGVDRVLITNFEDITSLNENSDGIVTGVTYVSTASTFSNTTYEFEVDQTSANGTQPATLAQNKFWTQNVSFNMSMIRYEANTIFEELALGKFVAWVKLIDGTWQVYGYPVGLRASAMDIQTGLAATDFQGYSVTLSVPAQTQIAPIVASGVITI